MEKDLNYKRIGDISNYYGGLLVMQIDSKYYWIIENYSTDLDDIDISDWQEIDKDLFDSLISYESKRIVNSNR